MKKHLLFFAISLFLVANAWGQVTLPLTEDFAKFEAGTEINPDTNNDVMSEETPDNFFTTPGWTGSGIYQADGKAYLQESGSNSEYAGRLTTPAFTYDQEEEGRSIIVSVKLKSANPDGDEVSISMRDENYEFFYPRKDISITNGLSDYSVTLPYTFTTLDGDDSIPVGISLYIDFSAGSPYFIDDIEIAYAPVSGGNEGDFGFPENSLHWEFSTTDSVLTISGEGRMTQWDFDNLASIPWAEATENNLKIKSLVIQEGVEQIANSAFANSVNLESMETLTDGIKAIGVDAFANCTSLSGTFYIPASVEWFGDGGENCNPFINCIGLTAFEVEEENAFGLSSVDGVIYGAGGAFLFAYPAGKKGKFETPAGVESINSHAFEGCTGIDTLVISPREVFRFGEYAFKGCTGLTDIYVPFEVLYNSAFEELLIFVFENTFEGVTTNEIKLHIPTGTTSVYEETPVWKDFEFILIENEAVSVESIAVNEQGPLFFVKGNNLSVRNVETGSNIEIYNVAGQKMLQQVYTGGDINIGNLPKGLYIVSIQTGKGVSSAKVVKQ